MKSLIRAVLGVMLVAMAAFNGKAVESTWNYAVQVSATVQVAPAQIVLSWPQDTAGVPASYTVYRKAPAASIWTSLATLSGSATSYTDTTVSTGTAYEYQIVKVATGYNGYGYIQAGINVPLVENRGKLVLIVDNTYASQLATELARLQQDLVGDGWTVLRHDVNRTDSVVSVKNLIQADYTADPANVKSVFLFGHVPVPYSGLLNPDGHPDHVGAWPADVFYGDMNGTWTDTSVNYTQTVNSDPVDAARISNVPGDGKFDQSTIPGTVELQVGRVDLANMPGRLVWGGPATFPSELELLRQYLTKDHNFRNKLLNVPRRALMGDYFGAHDGEAFAASGFRSFSPLVGTDSITNLNILYNDAQGTWVPELGTNNYLWAYGCGAGSYWTAGGLGNTDQYHDSDTVEVVQTNVQAVFTMLFGSWLGDWDHEDDYLRSILATKDYGLAAVWSGRPHWFMHPMGLGETIGYCARLTQNNSTLYQTEVNNASNYVHIALMGDPSLRMHPVAPAGNLGGVSLAGIVTLTWTPSSDPVAGYYVYRATSAIGPFTRLGSSLLALPTYVDVGAPAGATYMVRAVKLESSPSGTYTNASQGAFWTIGGGASTSGTDSTTNTPTAVTNSVSTSSVWVDDALPAGASGQVNGDSWNWVSSNPAPFSGTVAHQSVNAAGLHEHFFNWASATLAVNTGDSLFTYVYLDPANPPSEIMLSWNTTLNGGDWEHRAYWGADNINYGTDSSTGRQYMGALPATGQWVRLEVPASAVALEGATLQGMGFSTYDGLTTWDYSGKASQSSTTNPVTNTPVILPTVTVAATDPTGTIGSTSDTGTYTFTRTGSTTNALTVSYNFGGTLLAGIDFSVAGGTLPASVTIPMGSSSTTLTILGLANVLNANPLTASLSLAVSSAYTIGSSSSATITFSAGTVVTNPPGTNSTPALTNTAALDDITLAIRPVGDNRLRILSPTMLEVSSVNFKSPDPATVTNWNLISGTSFLAPALSAVTVTVNGQNVGVTAVGFKRRPLYAPLETYDLRIENDLYLQLATAVPDNATVSVKNPAATIWPATSQFTNTASPLRYSPAIHVNQEGYLPAFPKKAEVGYYLGSLGEMSVPNTSFSIVDANSGATVFTGTLTLRKDVGYVYTPTPYQTVYDADFSSVTTPGQYRLVVPGLGASFPFLVNDGIAMDFARAYELGLFEQRSGYNVAMPYTRFTHAADHTAPANIVSNATAYPFQWNTISNYAMQANADNPVQTAPLLTAPAKALYPFVNQGPVDVSGGHFDAGDYSKYTWDMAQFVHVLMFSVDSLPGVAALDNFGIPESGDGISDLMQEAKWEADALAKLQDADGGFYYVVYPQNSEYETSLPENGSPQILWPKNTAATAAAVAALAQCASSPLFKQTYPAAAASYLAKAQLGWQFLNNAIAKYGKTGAYQKMMHFGDDFADQDDLAWAACEMFLATGDQSIHTTLKSWFPDPTDSATFFWGWWRMYGGYGNAVRDYGFAVKSGRMQASQLDATYLAKCITTITNCGNDNLLWSQENAYGSSFPENTKHVRGAGWYFSPERAFDIAVAYQFSPRADYLDAILRNLNYEGGCNPVNQSYVTGLGWKRQRQVVDQYSEYDGRTLPKSGVPIGNIEQGFVFVQTYGTSLAGLTFPSDDATTAPYPYYDRWGDAFNVTTEVSSDDTVRSLAGVAWLATQTSVKTQAWKSATAQISAPTTVVPVGQPVTITVQVPGISLNGARVVWEGRDQDPAYGTNFVFTPQNNGDQWVEVEVQWPDGRRSFGRTDFTANSPNVVWVNDALPAGAQTGSDGGDSWTWVAASPTPFSGTEAHQSAIAAGLHEHWFTGASATMQIGVGDTLYVYAYLDPANPPTEIMVGWNDGTSWEHRAYWGANEITYGTDGTVSRVNMGALPPTGQWVRLEVPASVVGLEGSTLSGMDFSAYGGRVTWDAAGKTSPVSGTPTTTLAIAASADASRIGPASGVFTITRTGDLTSALQVNCSLGGTATNGMDYNTITSSVTIPAGAASANIMITPKTATSMVSAKTVTLSLQSSLVLAVAPAAGSATLTIAGNTMPGSLTKTAGTAAVLKWASTAGKTYHIVYRTNLLTGSWTDIGSTITATGATTSWTDTAHSTWPQCFYSVYVVN